MKHLLNKNVKITPNSKIELGEILLPLATFSTDYVIINEDRCPNIVRN